MSITAADRPAAGGSGRSPRPAPLPAVLAYPLMGLHALASLRLTVVLLAVSTVLVFLGTLAQMNSGNWTVVDRYFYSYWVKVDFALLVQFAQKFDITGTIPPSAKAAGWFPFVGGFTLGALLLVNLLAAHLVRFKLTWRRFPVILLHAGIALLLVNEIVTRELAVEQRMQIPEGGSAHYAYDIRNCELAFVDRTDPAEDRVVVVPGKRLARGGRIEDPQLPVDIEVVRYYPNALLDEPKPGAENPATAGTGLKAVVAPQDETSGVDTQQGADLPAAYVTLFKKGTNEAIGTYLVSVYATLLDLNQAVEAGGAPHDLSLRFTRYYKPYTVSLVKFRFDRYVGTEVAKNYSSQVILDDPGEGVREETTIAMNEPLRYRGETFYQADFDHKTEKATVLQVVQNPGWLLPYAACIVVGVGMVWHFGLGLAAFVRRRTAAAGGRAAIAPHTGFEKALPWVSVGLSVLMLGGAALMALDGGGGAFDLAAAGRLPVVEGGRVKPLDTVARVHMRVISNGESFSDGTGRSKPAMKWFLDVASAPRPAGPGESPDPGPAGKYKVFRIESDQVRGLMGLPAREGLRYSFEELQPKAKQFDEAVKKARAKPAKNRDLFDTKLLDLKRQVDAFIEVLFRAGPLVLPPADGADWRSAADADDANLRRVVDIVRARFPDLRDRKLTEAEQAEVLAAVSEARAEAAKADPAAAAWEELLAAYRKPDAAKFNTLVAEYRAARYPNLSHWDALRVNVEWFLNGWAPFLWCTVLYILAFLMTLSGWAATAARPSLGESLRRAAFGVLVVTLAVHVVFLLARMYLMGRPLVFVTNLYSSAVLIGCASVALCLVLERVVPFGLGNAVASALGMATGFLAHHLAAGADTLEMLQAVLDTSPWLATHVTTIVLGYAATYVAGVIAIGYILFGTLTPALNRPVPFGPRAVPLGRVVGMVMYGVICGATLLSFVGTVLGGIWADQSWGRFWGWDPKENGAVMIVAWNALILHARWAGLIKDRGVAVLALVGSMITTWSYFGTNQLGVGLHAYGFSNTLAAGCTITWVIHLALIGVGLAPAGYWRSEPNRATA